MKWNSCEEQTEKNNLLLGNRNEEAMKEKLLKKIENREIRVGVVGLGYVGLPLAVEKAKAGFKTVGFDVQSQKVDLVNKGHNYIGDIVDRDLE